MWQMIYTVADNLGMSFEYIIIVVALIGGGVFYAKDFKLGVTLNFFIFGLIFMWFYADSLNYVPALILFFIHLIVMSLTLYFVSRTGGSAQGGFI